MSLYLPNLPLLLPSSRGPLRLAFHYFLFFRSSNTFYLLYRSKHSTLSSSSPLPPRFIDRIVIDYPYLLYAGLHPGVISSIVVVLALTRRRYIVTHRYLSSLDCCRVLSRPIADHLYLASYRIQMSTFSVPIFLFTVDVLY